jgi:murein tripeptide amidase MpaA
MTVQRLGKNVGGYHGETIDVPKVLHQIEQAVAGKNWAAEVLPLTSSPDLKFLAYRRKVDSSRLNIYLSTGIHGDEPAGPLAALQLLQEDRWPADASIWLCPMLNPAGLALSRRENANGVDLNRDYRHLLTEEVRTHVQWLERQPRFDISLCLHEDWEASGFYIYETNPNKLPSVAEKIVEAVARICPIETATLIDNWEAAAGIIRPNIKPEERPQWAEALYLIMNNSRLGYTLEAPSDFPLTTRVAALVTGVRAVLDLL